MVAIQPLRGLRLEVDRRPDELVLGEVELDAIAGDDVVTDDPVDFAAAEAEAVHAFELEEVFDPAAGAGDNQAAFDLELVEVAPALGVLLDAGLFGDLVGDKDSGGAGVE